MGTVTHVDFQAARDKAQAPQADDFAWADQLAAFWYSPAGRWIAAGVVGAVVVTGLGFLVFGLWMMAGEP